MVWRPLPAGGDRSSRRESRTAEAVNTQGRKTRMSKTGTASRKIRPGSGIASRYRALLLTHRSLDEKLDEEMRRPLPDSAVIGRIKRRKLVIKDEMIALERLFDAMNTPVEAVVPQRQTEWRPGARYPALPPLQAAREARAMSRS